MWVIVAQAVEWVVQWRKVGGLNPSPSKSVIVSPDKTLDLERVIKKSLQRALVMVLEKCYIGALHLPKQNVLYYPNYLAYIWS